MYTLKVALPLCAALMFAGPAFAAATGNCEDLRNLKLENTLITRAESFSSEFRGPVSAGQQRSSIVANVPAICHVEGVVSPVSGSKIGFVVWLPKDGWTQRLSMIGNGGYDSSISYGALRDIVQRGSVAVATDTGHQGGDLEFAFDRPETIQDWGHRAGHESVVAAKAVAAAFYGSAPKYSYFNGCSTGGHQALAAAQYHPEDFDGIVAGSPGNNRSNLNLEFLWMFVQNHPDGDANKTVVPESKLGMVHDAVVAKCDTADGVKDGVVDPSVCKFDPAELTCKAGDNADCLTPAQVAVMQKIYAGPKNPRTGEQIYARWPVTSEGIGGKGWAGYWADPQRPTEPQRTSFYRYWVFNNQTWDWRTFDWDKDVATVTEKTASLVNATDANLSAFRAHGGKIIMYVGMADPVGSGYEPTTYYERMITANGAGADGLRKTQDSIVFYQINGMAHCGGGDGVYAFDGANALSEDADHNMTLALQNWVEQGKPARRLVAARYVDGDRKKGVQFTRPLCPYPQVARYVGGPTNDARSFNCAASYK